MAALVTRLGRTLFRLALFALPAAFREEWSDELTDLFLSRQARALERGGPLAAAGLWLREAAGLARSAWRARRPDPWSRRTLPHGHDPGGPGSPSPGRLMDQLSYDLRFALRSFLRRPGMTVLALTSLALGIGASTAMFSVVDSVLLQPLPYEEPEELVLVYTANPQWTDHPTLSAAALHGILSDTESAWVEENQQTFESLGSFWTWGGVTMSGDGRPERLSMVRVTPGTLPTLRVGALRGRLFTEEDDPRNGGRSVLLTERFWQTRFGADPDIVGSTLSLNDEPFTVVGVLPRDVDALTSEADIWLMRTDVFERPAWGNHSTSGVVARLREGATVEQAHAEMERLFTSVPAEAGHTHGASVFPALQDATRRVRAPLLILIAGAILLLAVGCGNVAALLLGAGIDREREIAVRGALGAGRARLTRQLLTESLLLAGAGTVGGVVIAAGLHEVLLWLAPPSVPRIAEATLDGRALGFAASIAGAAGVAFGMVPALGLSRPDLASVIGSSRGATSGKTALQSFVVVGELALATVLLASAGLLGRTLFQLNATDTGIDAAGLYSIRTAVPFQRFQNEEPEARSAAIAAYFQEVLEAVEQTPGVSSVAVTSNVPLSGDRSNNDVTPEGWNAEAEGETLIAERRFVSDGYFRTTGIDLVEGRDFTPDDDRVGAAPVMVLSQGLADRAWPEESALGKQVSYWGRPPATVVGVARDLRDETLTAETRYAYYVPGGQFAEVGTILARIEGDGAAVIPSVRERIWQVDPDLPITQTISLEEILRGAVSQERYRARLMIAFALLAGLFAAMGVYGVVARSVARRTREMGIRQALGASRANVHGVVLRQGFRLALYGAVIGLGGAVLTGRLLEDMLFEVSAADPVMLGGTGLAVAALSLLASLPPSRRATRVDPVEALREE